MNRSNQIPKCHGSTAVSTFCLLRSIINDLKLTMLPLEPLRLHKHIHHAYVLIKSLSATILTHHHLMVGQMPLGGILTHETSQLTSDQVGVKHGPSEAVGGRQDDQIFYDVLGDSNRLSNFDRARLDNFGIDAKINIKLLRNRSQDLRLKL